MPLDVTAESVPHEFQMDMTDLQCGKVSVQRSVTMRGEYIVARTATIYKTGYRIDNGIYWIKHNYSYTLITESLTITTDSHN
jgi:hypothetical protein